MFVFGVYSVRMLQNFTWQIVNIKHLSALYIVDVSSGQNS